MRQQTSAPARADDRVLEFDGVRGVAVLLVIAFHVFKRADYFTANQALHFLTGLTSIGWVGVDIFFTLSGFLITSILLRTKTDKRYFKNFYMRRVLRIVPIYLVLIGLTLAFAPKLEVEFTSRLNQILPLMLLFQQNWLAIFSDLKMTHYLWVTWSLAVEEQFYLLLPLAAYLLRKETLFKAGVGFVFLSILTRLSGVTFLKEIGKASVYLFFYYNSFTRFEQLLIGALLAIGLTDLRGKEFIRKYSIPVFWLCLFGFLGIALTSPVTPHPAFGYAPLTIGGYTLSALSTAGLLGAFVTRPASAWIRRPFQNKILIFFGKYSYSLYLFHTPAAIILLDALWHTGARGWTMYVAYIVAALAATILCALLAWNLIEKRALSLKKYFEYAPHSME
ncbi:MAG: hypothetical protein Fur002_24560 [Anaerolineales bacterium]